MLGQLIPLPMQAHQLRQHLHQRVTLHVQNVPGPIPGIVKWVDHSMLTLRRLVSAPPNALRSEEIDIPCVEIHSIAPEKWQ